MICTTMLNGTNGKDAVEHIEYYLKIIDPIKLPNVDHNKLRIVVFSISLTGGARRWFDITKESITCWVDLTAKFFRKYYPPSRIEENNTPIIKWDPTNPRFEGWLATKFVNYKTMDIFTKGALWDYWKIGGDEIEIETDVFDYETPLCLAFNEFNYLLKVDPNLLTKDIMRFKTYEDYKDDWIYEWNENVPWVYDKSWLDNGIWKEPKPDGYCNGGNLPGAYHIGNSLHYQDLEWYEALADSELKNEALRNKVIMKGLISDDESSNDCLKRWKSHEIYYHNYDEEEYENETHKEGMSYVVSKLAKSSIEYEIAKRIAENVLVGIGKFTFPIDFIILDMPEDIKVPLILIRSFLSTARAKIDVYKRKITLRVGEERIVFISV
ncbi:reverse transcriptase domain-containing protein [Tanacetum coccineum]|uniref:Reverse transcriptase domain-containing protein n=1 Tax=Tanacetum coccineum TaxID=301880 RepID=A0ABQ5I203_9ASTR